MDVKLQESSDNSTFTDITDATFTQVTDAASSQKISINTNDVKRYLRAVGTIGGTSSPAFTYTVQLIYGKVRLIMAIQDTFAFLDTNEFGSICQIGSGDEFVVSWIR